MVDHHSLHSLIIPLFIGFLPSQWCRILQPSTVFHGVKKKRCFHQVKKMMLKSHFDGQGLLGQRYTMFIQMVFQIFMASIDHKKKKTRVSFPPENVPGPLPITSPCEITPSMVQAIPSGYVKSLLLKMAQSKSLIFPLIAW